MGKLLRGKVLAELRRLYAQGVFEGYEDFDRVGIANSRLVHVDPERVTFRTKEGKTETLSPVEFLRRLVQHVLPAGFVKIRHYGLLAGVNVQGKLALARSLLEARKRPSPVGE